MKTIPTPDASQKQAAQSKSQRTREAIVEAAFKAYAENGLHGTNSKVIAKRAGVSIGTFYNYFEDKKSLFLEVLDRHAYEIMDVIESRCEQIKKRNVYDRESMQDIIEAVFEAHTLSPDFHREVTAMELTDPEVAARYARYQKEYLEQLVGWFSSIKSKLRVHDIETSVALMCMSIEQVVHTIIMSQPPVPSQRLISELADMLYLYLFKDSQQEGVS